MKHKPTSFTIPKVLKVFEKKDQADKIAGIIRPVGDRAVQPKFILSSHLEILMLQLSHKTLQDPDFILQKFVKTADYNIYTCKFALPDFTVSVSPMSSKYLINGKYLNQELLSTCASSESYDSEIKLMSQDVLNYLSKLYGKIVLCEFEWFRDNIFCLVNINNISEGMILAGKSIIRSVSESAPNTTILQPASSRLHNKRIKITNNVTYTELELSKITRESYTTPKSFKLSYEFKTKQTQTLTVPCCDQKNELDHYKIELEKMIQKKKALQEELEKIIESNHKKLEEIDNVWKSKCNDLADLMAEKMYADRKKFENKIKFLKSHSKFL